MMAQVKPIAVSEEQRAALESMVRSQSDDARAARRARIILLASAGLADREIARELGIGRIQAARWRRRFAEGGVEAVRADLPRSGRKSTIDAAEIVRVTTQERPEGAARWSTRKLAARLGISDTTVHKVWRARGIKLHLAGSSTMAHESNFLEQLEDIVGLYVSPPEHAIVLCGKGMGWVQPVSCDSSRHDVTPQLAAAGALENKVASGSDQVERHVEWLDFLCQLDREIPTHKELHLICDNYATHRHPQVIHWLSKHPRFQVHFTSNSASWRDMVERFCHNITRTSLCRRESRSVNERITSIDEYIAVHNQTAWPVARTNKCNGTSRKVIRTGFRPGSMKNEALYKWLVNKVRD